MYEILEEIEKTQGTLKKQEILFIGLKNNEHLNIFLRLVYDDSIYGVSDRTFEKVLQYDENIDGVYFDIGELMFRKIQGNTNLYPKEFKKYARESILKSSGKEQLEILMRTFANLTPLSAKWLSRLILKDLKMGISLKSINKVLVQLNKNKIEKFEVQLAGKFDTIEDYWKKYKDKTVIVGVKYDGFRAIVEKVNNKTMITSRQGKNIDYVPELIEQLETEFKDIPTFKFDGEIICKDFSTLQQRIGRKLENIKPIECLKFVVFDVLKYCEIDFIKKSQEDRRIFLKMTIPIKNFIKIEESIIVYSFKELKIFYDTIIERKEEGIIIKFLDETYDFGSRKNWIKIKPIFSNTMKIINKKYGTGRKAGLISAIQVKDRSGKIKSFVGAGLTDNDIVTLIELDRENKLIGTHVEIMYNEITKNKFNDFSLRFPRFIMFRFDKNISDNFKEFGENKDFGKK